MVLDEEKRRAIAQIYETPGSPAAFSNVNSIYKEVQRNRDSLPYITKKDIVEFLSGVESYTLTKPKVKPGSGRKLPKIVCGTQRFQYVSDLASMETYSAENDRVKYLLCVSDCFSKMLFVEPLTNKSGRSVVEALDKILDRAGIPAKFQTDRGKYKLILECM